MIDEVITKINQLVIRQRKPFIEQHRKKDGTVVWYHRQATLTDNAVRSHIEGRRTIGVYYAGQGTSFLVFDVDCEDDPVGQEIRVKGIVQALMDAGLSAEDIHVSTSGQKGYHIELYFSGLIAIKRVARFGRAIIAKLGDHRRGMEIRPEESGRRGVKLPLAVHKATGRRQKYVNPVTLEPVEDSMAYFLGIGQIPLDRMNAVIDSVLRKPAERYPLESAETRLDRAKREFTSIHLPKNNNSKLRQEAETLLRYGLRERGTRHESQFKIALYLKESGVSMEEAIEIMSDWAKRQFERGMTNEKNLSFVLKEAKRCVEETYQNENYVGLLDSRGQTPTITTHDLAFAAQFQNKNMRKIVWALILLGRMYHKDGQFDAPMEGIGEMTGLTRQTVSKYLDLLQADGVIQLVEEYDHTKKRARRYFMPNLVEEVRDRKEVQEIMIESDSIGRAYVETFDVLEHFAKRRVG
ncbi:hypothetical protein [Kyrpidia sp.]|uniref:TOTE conflict system archaeo-eukaryotic primase domain-containing protein n=1 Tax=Kyrpidia sp. TaxID=2073077 RepID=UPI00258C0B42|nr:hypothetical protein [Kyrpidia sp.]MCL6575555.1 hypothetical protein [Kyrpidia sp.]